MYKHKRNTDSRMIKWLRHEGFNPVLNPFFKNYFKNLFLKKSYKHIWLFVSSDVTIFRRYYDNQGWTFVVCFSRQCSEPPALYVFTAKTRTPLFNDSFFDHAEPVCHHYLAGAKTYVRGQESKLPKATGRQMKLLDWWKSRK